MKTAPSNHSKPYTKLHADIVQELSSQWVEKPDPFLLMAVCVYASMGVPWYCKCDSLFKSNMKRVSFEHGDLQARVFVNRLTVTAARNRGQIPKFIYRKQWFEQVELLKDSAGLTQIEKLILSCSYGLAQMPALNMFPREGLLERLEAVMLLSRSVDYQIATLFYELHTLGAWIPGSTERALNLHYSGPYDAVRLQYGAKMIDMANHFRRLYGEEASEVYGADVKTRL